MKPDNIVEVSAPINEVQSLVLSRIIEARAKADKKWGEGTGSNTFESDRALAVTVLIEEVGEVARAVLEKDGNSLEQELYDVAQVACAWLENIQSSRDNALCRGCGKTRKECDENSW